MSRSLWLEMNLKTCQVCDVVSHVLQMIGTLGSSNHTPGYMLFLLQTFYN